MENKELINQSILVRTKSLIQESSLILLFALLTAVGAWFEIPTKPVPFTLQTFFVLLSGALLGARYGFISQLTYLFLGLVGLPVFAGLSAGIAKLVGPTGGYLLSFPIAAFITGYLIEKNKNFLWTIFSVTIGMLVIFSIGTIFLNIVYFKNFSKSIEYGFLIFSWWDGLKIIAVASIYRKFQKF